MEGLFERDFYVGGEKRNKGTIDDEFHGHFFVLPVYYLSDVFKLQLESFWSYYRIKLPLRKLSCLM